MVKMTLKVEVNDLHIQYQLKVSQDGCCKFGDSSPHLWRVITQTSQFSWNCGSKWPRWPWRSRSMTSTSNTNRKYPSQDTCLVQIWWFKLKSVKSYCADKVKFMDGQTDGQTDEQTQATTVPLRPEKPSGKNHQWWDPLLLLSSV